MEISLAEEWEWMKDPDTGKSGGSSYGYTTGYVLLKSALKSAGVDLIPDDRVWLTYSPPHTFKYVRDRVNVFFSMWEAEDIPPDILEVFDKADFIIVPSSATKDALIKGGIKKKIFVCYHAIDTDYYSFVDRRELRLFGDVVRFLWVGAPTVRKGIDLFTKAFCEAFLLKGVKNVELYVKSSFFGKEGRLIPMVKYNTIIDTRNFPRDELRELYWNSHAFVFPSRGEGVGLPVLEAMSTGMPVIAPPYSGMKDFMLPAHSYPVRWHKRVVEYGVLTTMCEANTYDIAKFMREVYFNREEAARRGKKAAEFVRSKFSVVSMGERLKTIFSEIKEQVNG